jgi:hypothetical protein
MRWALFSGRQARHAVLVGIVALPAVLAGACSLAFPADQSQCSVDRDCTSRGGAFAGSACVANVCIMPPHSDAHADAPRDGTVQHDAPHDVPPEDAGNDAGADGDAGEPVDGGFVNDWSCLGHVTYPAPTDAQVTLTVPYTQYLGAAPIPGLRAQACIRMDPTCSVPIGDASFTNDAGLVSFQVPSGYDGYIYPNWDAGFPDLVYIDPPLFTKTTFAAQGLIPQATLSLLAGAIGKVDGSPLVINPQDGIIFLGTRDCKGALASGVQFSLSPSGGGALLVYVVANFPSLSATETDKGGAAAYINVPVESVTVTATLVATGQRIGSVDGYVRANSISGFEVGPTP